MSSWVCSHMSWGGIDHVASSRSSDVSESMSYRSNASTYRARSASWSSSAGCRVSASSIPTASSVARARWSALLTDATDVPSSSATSEAFQRKTSRRISTARCLGGRCCSAATKASRIDSRDSTTSAGSPPAGTTRPSGTGRIHAPSGSASGSGVSADRRRREIHRARPALLATQHVETDVGDDAVQPRAQGGPALEGVEALPRAQERLLHRVLRLEGGSQHPVRVRGELGPVSLQLEFELVGSGVPPWFAPPRSPSAQPSGVAPFTNLHPTTPRDE